MAMAIANFFWPCRDCSVGPHYFCIICKNLTHVCYIKLFLIEGGEVAVDNFSYRDTIHEFILVIHMLVLSLPPCSKQSQKYGRRVASELIPISCPESVYPCLLYRNSFTGGNNENGNNH